MDGGYKVVLITISPVVHVSICRVLMSDKRITHLYS